MHACMHMCAYMHTCACMHVSMSAYMCTHVYCISSIKRPGVYFFGVRFTRRLNRVGVYFSLLAPAPYKLH